MRTTAISSENDTPRNTSRLGWVFTLPLLAVLVMAGCKHQAELAANTDPVGTYTLVSVNGKEVPCTIEHDGHSLAVESGTFVINADGTCSSKILFSPPEGRVAIREVKANYTQDGSKLTMKWEGAGTTIGAVAGDSFTMTNEGMPFAYRRTDSQPSSAP